MKLSVEHETSYEYGRPVMYSIQQVRLTPRADLHQHIHYWKIEAPTRSSLTVDTYQNKVHTLTINRLHQRVCIRAKGLVEIHPLINGVLPGLSDPIPTQTFTAATLLTKADKDIQDLGRQAMMRPGPFLDKMIELANTVADRVVYKKGSTDVHSTAIEALELGYGVCQDHTHVMLACLRSLGIACRYVSGYYFSGPGSNFDSHAWVDVFDEHEQRWISIDPTNRALTSDLHCRLAIGRDYETAAPVRGMRSGGSQENLKVSVELQSVELV